VPGLGNIRGIGRAFQGQDDTVDRSEVIFLVKATVVDNQTLIDLGEHGMDRVETAAVASRNKLLPWSRSKLTASHLINARAHYDEAMALTGEEREEKLADALYCVDMALHLNPSMVDALLLKEEITGEQLPIYLESNVIQTFDAVLDDEMKLLDLPELDAKAPAQEPEADAQAQDEADAEKAAAEEQALADIVAQALNDNDAAQAQAAEQDDVELDEPAGLANVEEHDEAMDDVWLQQMLDQSRTKQVEPQVVEEPSDESDEQVTEVETTSDASSGDPELVEELEDIEPIDVKPQDESFAEGADTAMKIFGYSWRSMTTAQLLQLAAQAAEDAEAEGDETYEAQAGVDTDTE
jgi:hypothetical protein